ncbi:MAG: DUF362 domain-containing protein [Deltaproteobacteria bacterium]|nr:DUF362 domain-containing protein [Deltaproteobacteria bacterium]
MMASMNVEESTPYRDSCRVLVLPCPTYEAGKLDSVVERLMAELSGRIKPGDRVLVKPNLVSAVPLACTGPEVVRSACRCLLDAGARVVVGDSPGFGRAGSVARACGLDQALADLGLTVQTLNQPRHVVVGTRRIVVSRRAMEADHVVNVPRLKAHSQMRVTGAIKNLFGCVPGTRKAWIHAVLGDRGNRFPGHLVDVIAALPPVFSLVDAVTAMHRTGPMKGEVIQLGLLASSQNPVALDTALWTMLGLDPDLVPLWAECRRRNLPGNRAEDLIYPLSSPRDFDLSGFVVPETLAPEAFGPVRLVRSTIRRLAARFSV